MTRDAAADGRRLVEVGEYAGEPSVSIAATQLGSAFSDLRKRQVVDEWVDFFMSGPTPIRSLRFTTRTPDRLFNALSGQRQLTALAVKWGDYRDLSVLKDMSELRSLRLAGAAKIRELGPLACLPRVQALQHLHMPRWVRLSAASRAHAIPAAGVMLRPWAQSRSASRCSLGVGWS